MENPVHCAIGLLWLSGIGHHGFFKRKRNKVYTDSGSFQHMGNGFPVFDLLGRESIAVDTDENAAWLLAL